MHFAPEIGKFKIMSSFAQGKWDRECNKSVVRWAYGFSFRKGPFYIRGESMAGVWELWENWVDDKPRDLVPSGYYLKAVYRFSKKFKFTLEYSGLNNNFYEEKVLLPMPGKKLSHEEYVQKQFYEDEVTAVISPNLIFTVSDGVLLMAQYNDVKTHRRRSPEIDIGSDRFTLGLKVVF